MSPPGECCDPLLGVPRLVLRAAAAAEYVCSPCLISHALQTPLAAAWSDAFLKAITGTPVEIADLASADKELYDKKVSYVRDGRYKENAMVIGDLGLTFADESNGADYMAEDAATRLPGAPVELKAGGKDIGAPLCFVFHSRVSRSFTSIPCQFQLAGAFVLC